MKRRPFIAMLLLAMTAGRGHAQGRKADSPKEGVLHGASFTTLLAAFRAADAMDLLEVNNGEFTLYAPGNKAFDAMPRELREKLFKPENKAVLRLVLSHHIVPQTNNPKETKNETFKTLADESVVIRREVTGLPTVGGVPMNNSGAYCKKGTFAGLGGVMIPEKAKKALGLPERTD